MNKTAIKNFAVQARITLREAVEQKAYEYSITPDAAPGAADMLTTAGGRLLTDTEKEQRKQLLGKTEEKGYDQIIEETAYTWFNRFIALRFMEVNGYLPSRVRVFTDENNNFEPQILKEAIDLEIEGLDIQKVYELKQADNEEALYKYLLITQCNALSSILPGMFQKIEDCTELLLPDNLLRSGSVIEQMVSQIPEEDWKDEVQIIGWLYQYYVSELNSKVYDGSYSKNKISKELLPAATTIYTPDWAVRYMVENSLGRLWLEGHQNSKAQLLPNDEERKEYFEYKNVMKKSDETSENNQFVINYDFNSKRKWHYYIDEAEQRSEDQIRLNEIRKRYAEMVPDQIKVLDPCCGSGHILVYMFDVLMQIYETNGYTKRESVISIIKNNLYGLDIDERAAQLSYFAVMMKACQYDHRFLTRGIQPNIYDIKESNNIDIAIVKYFSNGNEKIISAIEKIISEFKFAKEYGSIILVSKQEWNLLYSRFDEIRNNSDIYSEVILRELLPIVGLAEILSTKYDVVITNPPYLGASRFSNLLNDYVKKYYPDEKSDLSMVMFKQSLSRLCKENGFVAFITTSSWMFLSSFEKIRKYLEDSAVIDTLVDFGTELFDGKVGHNPIVAWVTRNSRINYKMSAIRLVDYCYSRRDEKEIQFFNKNNYYISEQANFSKIPGSPVAYWVSEKMLNAFENGTLLGNIADSKQGLATTDNKRFLRIWSEIDYNKIIYNVDSINNAIKSGGKWFPYNKGGEFRKWFGNNEYIVNYENDGKEIKSSVLKKYPYLKTPEFVVKNTNYYFKKCISWSLISSSVAAFRYKPLGFIFDVAGMSCFATEDKLLYLLALCNTKVVMKILEIIAPTMNFQCGDIANIPVFNSNKKEEINKTVEQNIEISRNDWDSYEISWDFKRNPLV